MMVINRKYDTLDLDRGRLDRTVFSNRDIYQVELDKIFGRAWLFIGHESIIPNPNDFFLTYMGEDPVILCRTASGSLRAFLNMCRHRGNRIVRADEGNAKNFMCAYHGWTYSNEGKLVSVPGLQEAYYGELDVDSLGLVEVAHLDTYAGFVFATWAEDAPTLEASMGNMRYYMDMLFNRRDGGIELIGPDKWIIPNNWKNSADNFVGDQYHAVLSHRSATLAFARRLGRQAPPMRYVMPGASEVSPGNGSGLLCRVAEDEESFRAFRTGQVIDPVVSEYQGQIESEMEERLGFQRARRLQPGHALLWPNMGFLSGNHTVRMFHPRGLFQTETWSFHAVDKAAPEEVKRAWRIRCIQSFGPSGMLEQDDMDNWRSSSEAGKSITARKYHYDISMGVGHEWTNPDLPGRSSVNNAFSEINMRSFHARWQQFMNAESWADIPIDPITAQFEGRATMKG